MQQAVFSPYQSSETFRQDLGPTTKGYDERTLSRYLGPQLTSTQPNQLERLNYGARNLPDMFRNRRLQVQDSLEGFIVNGFEFYTYLVPWLVTNEKSVKMNVYRHNVRPATITPNKGVSRQQTHQVSTKEATTERYGASFYIEGDMMGTPEGDRQYIRNLMGMAQGCQLTVNQETMGNLIDCKNYVQDWIETRGRRNWVEDVMEMEIARFAGMAADSNFLDQVVQQSITAFGLRNIVPDAIIAWDTMPLVESMINATKTGFWQMGPNGRDAFVAGPDGVTAIRKLPVFLARPFTVNEDDGPKQFLARDTTIGERYPMSWNDRRGEKFGTGCSSFCSDQREIRIWDLPTDSMRAISIKEALLQARIWNPVTKKYSEELQRAVAEFNYRANTEQGFAEKAKYGDPAALDADPSTVRIDNPFFAFDTTARIGFLPHFIGQFSTDVIKTTDLRQMAEQMLMSAFGANRDAIELEVSNARSFVARWEDEAKYEDNYWQELIDKNIAKSVAADGTWVGERNSAQAPRDWVPNEKGSLELPAHEESFGKYAAGFANYPGFETFKTSDWPLESRTGAERTLKTVDEVTRQMVRVNKYSRLGKTAAVAEWFHVKKPEIVVWEVLIGRRAPMFIAAAPSGGRAGAGGRANKGDAIKKDVAAQTIKYTKYPGNYAFVATLPVAAIISFAVSTVLGGTRGSEVVAIFRNVVSPLGAAATDQEKEKNAEEENARTAIANSMIARFMYYTKNEEKPHHAVYFIRDVATALGVGTTFSNVTDDYRKKFFALSKDWPTKMARKQIEAKEKEYDAAFEKESPANQATIKTQGEELHDLGVADVEILDPVENTLPVAQKQQLRSILLSSEKNKSTPMTVLADAIERVEVLGRRYGNFSWEKLQQWGTDVAARLSDAQTAELADVINSYNAAGAAFDSAVKTVFNVGTAYTDDEKKDIRASETQIVINEVTIVGSDKDKKDFLLQVLIERWRVERDATKRADLRDAIVRNGGNLPKNTKEEGSEEGSGGDDDDEARNARERRRAAPKKVFVKRSDNAAKMYFFRAPLTMTRTLLYSAVENDVAPLIQAADESTGFRTVFSAQRNPSASVYVEDPYLVMGRRPHMLDISASALRSFHNSSLVQQHIIYAAAKDETGFVAPAHVREKARKIGSSRFASAKRSSDEAFGVSAAMTSPRGDSDYTQKRRATGAAVPAMQAAQKEMLRAMAKGVRTDRDDDVDDKTPMAAAARLFSGAKASFMSAGLSETEKAQKAEEDAITMEVNALKSYEKQTEAMFSNEFARMTLGMTMEYRWKAALNDSDLLRLAQAWIANTDATNPDAFVEMVDNNINFPFNIDIIRPQMKFSMYSLIVMRAGRDTGVNIIGDRNFAMQDQVLDKVAMGHLTFYFKCIIWRPQNIDHLLDIYPQKYRSGVDMTWIKGPENFGLKKNTSGSLMAWIYTLGESVEKSAMSLIAADAQRAQPSVTNLPDQSLAATLSTTDFYSRHVWKIPLNQTSYTQEVATFKKQRMQLNVVVYAGKYIAWDKSKKCYVLKTEGTGHLKGNKSGPSTGAVWMGQSNKQFPQTVICV